MTTYVPELLLPQVASLFKNLGKPNAAAGTWVAVQLMLYVTRASRFHTFLSSRMTCLHGQTNMVRRIGGDDGRFYGYLGEIFLSCQRQLGRSDLSPPGGRNVNQIQGRM